MVINTYDQNILTDGAFFPKNIAATNGSKRSNKTRKSKLENVIDKRTITAKKRKLKLVSQGRISRKAKEEK